MIVKMAKKEDKIKVTNHTEYEVCHLYNDTALNEIIRIMRDEELTSKSTDVLLTDMKEHLEEILNHGEQVRRHGELFEDNKFKCAKIQENHDENSSSETESGDDDMELDDEDIEWHEDEEDLNDEDYARNFYS